ncbi:MAG: hypothetical protein CM1200mP41_37610 [Gammaproteobacteria bacterium]|nr:MAG: hypothetical protein CM1200mP41_37610 [Gammaproteobacteria bacterium]
MHAAFIADELEIPRVRVPLGPGKFFAAFWVPYLRQQAGLFTYTNDLPS